MFVFYPFFQVESVILSGRENLNKETLLKTVENCTRKHFLFLDTRSIFLVKEEEIKKRIFQETLVVEDVAVRKIFPAKVEVIIKERVPISVWCAEKKEESCYYVDKQGIVLQRADRILRDFPIFLKETRTTAKEEVVGKRIIDPDLLMVLFLAKEGLAKENISVSYFKIPAGKTVEAHLKEGWKILFSSKNTEAELENFRVIIEEIDDLRREDLDYIDLRFGDRIYYK